MDEIAESSILLNFIGVMLSEESSPKGNRTPVSGVRGRNTIGAPIPQRPANKGVKGATMLP